MKVKKRGKMSESAVQEMAERVADLAAKKLGTGGRDIAARLRHAARRTPRGVRRDIRTISDALPMAEHPKLARRIDLPRLEAAERRIAAHLNAVDRGQERMTMFLGMLGSIAFGVLVLAAGVLIVLVQRGLI